MKVKAELVVPFDKFSGCGNDFVIIDNRAQSVSLLPNNVQALCDRHLGIGADGVILLENGTDSDYAMRIFNADGSEAEMCGNGLRCLMAFISKTNMMTRQCTIASLNRIHHAEVIANALSPNAPGSYCVRASMGAPTQQRWNIPLHIDNNILMAHYLDTGVPHAVVFVDDIDTTDLTTLGPAIRYHHEFSPSGCNATFAERKTSGKIFTRTYERGVEAETLACGTGAVAAVVAAAQVHHTTTTVQVRSGQELEVAVQGSGDVSMTGPCQHVFSGSVVLST